MKTKNLRENYTSVCQYCGVVFKNNRSTSKFCCDQHRSLYGQHGPMISPMIKDRHGNDFNAEEVLQTIYAYAEGLVEHRDGWSVGYAEEDLNDLFSYYGPFPAGSQLLVMTSFVVKMEECHLEDEPLLHYFFKPIALLTKEEKATAVFLSVREGQRKENVHKIY